MITNISIERFKPFRSVSVNLKPITYMLGENGIGKSSISQALLLLKQSGIDKGSGELVLNGDFVRIGNGVDALNRSADEDTITIAVEFQDSASLKVIAKYVAEGDVLPAKVEDGSDLKKINSRNFVYLSAGRIGPVLVSKFSYHDNTKKLVNEIGDNALGLLLAYGKELLSKDDKRTLCANSRTIKSVFDYYLSKISTGASIDLQDISNIDSVGSTFSFSKEKSLAIDGVRPTNVGFGISYAASIVIACLLAAKGDVLIIENPEAHLHTRGQRAVVELLSLTAAAGVQIICETHSREVIYSSRKLVEEGVLDKEMVTFNLVQERDGEVVVDQWYPITEPIGNLGDKFNSFIEIFGSATDFIR